MDATQERRKAVLVFNPASGSGSDELEALRAHLEARFALTVFATCEAEDADHCAREGLELGPDLMIAAGGDGTVSMVAGVLVGSKIPLAILPRGTSNSIATGLGIADVTAALEVLEDGVPLALDTACANGQPMLLHASIGLHAAAIAGASRESKNRWGLLSYIAEGIAKLGELEPFEVELETDQQTITCRAVNVTAANVAPRKTVLAQGPAIISPTDGMLSVTIVTATSLLDAVVTGAHLFRTALQQEPATHDNVGHFSTKKLRVVASPLQPLLIDGEPAGEGALEIECIPKSLVVMVPREHVLDERPEHDAKLEGLPELSIEPLSK
jgi:YegS/Rv2252/BmrU family lipid kinase